MSLVYKQFILILFESRNQINTKLLYILAETLINDMDKKQIAYVWYGFLFGIHTKWQASLVRFYHDRERK
jgi:hypothetical protein